MQRVVYAKLSKVLTATCCCLLLIAINRIKLSMRQLSISLKRFSINVAIELNKNSACYAWNAMCCLHATVHNSKFLL